MIRVMVVEDEPFACRRIQRLIELVDPNFKVVATAMDGEEALRILARTSCDLVFTDIRMPIMDGVEFMSQLREKWPACMIVVVSGYSDFSYVSTALHMEAMDYILKPISEEEMRTLLEKIRKDYLCRQDAVLRGELASRINKAVPHQTEEGIGDDEDDLGVFLFCAGAMPICENADLCPGSEFWGRIQFRKMIEKCLEGIALFSWEFMGVTAAERIVIIKSELDDMSLAARYLHNEVASVSTMPVTCVCHKAPSNLKEVEHTLRALRATLEQSVRIGKSRLIALGANREEEPDRSACFDLILPEARMLLEGTEFQQGRNTLTPMFRRFDRENWPQTDIFGLFGVAFNQILSERAARYAQTQQLRNALEESFSSALSLQELQSDLFALCEKKKAQDPVTRQDQSIAKRIADYLDEHYAEHITNQTLSGIFGYVPSYLSILFRRTYDISPVEYLTNVRIEHAKQIMKRHPDILIKDIADSVGFKSQHHFSHTFKKHERVWPTSYKAQNQS